MVIMMMTILQKTDDFMTVINTTSKKQNKQKLFDLVGCILRGVGIIPLNGNKIFISKTIYHKMIFLMCNVLGLQISQNQLTRQIFNEKQH